MIRQLRRLAKDEAGAALAEFALIAPVMIVLFFGTVELVQAVEARQRLSHVAAAVADIVAQERAVSDAELNDLFAASPALMAPFSAASLGQRVASFSADAGGMVRMDWEASGAAYAGGAPLAVPDGYLQPGESAIVADVSYTYQPALTLVFPTTLKFQKRAYLHPRLVDRVARN